MASNLNTAPHGANVLPDDSWTNPSNGLPDVGAEVKIKLAMGDDVSAVWTGDSWRTDSHGVGRVLGWR